MSPQDKVERVLKEIHVTFAKSPTYNGQPDKMIIDRRHFLSLLDRLNKGIFDMMEQYEQTRQSRQNAERAFKRKGDEIIEQANASASDIYAASVIYTADAIGRIRDLMDQTNDSMNDLFRQFKLDLKEQKDLLKSHESELEAQLADLADTRKYLMVLEEMNRERERKNRDLAAEKEAGNQYARSMVYTSATQADVKVNDEYFEKSGKPTPGEREAKASAPAEKPDVQVNQNAAYFKWKAEQDAKKAQESGGEQEASEKIEENGEHGSLEKAKVDAKQEVSKKSETNGKQRTSRKKSHAEKNSGSVRLERDSADADQKTASYGQNDGGLDDSVMRGHQRKKVADASQNGVKAGRDMDTSVPSPDEESPAEYPNPDFPNEEAIRQAVLEDERKAMAEMEKAERKSGNKKSGGAGGVLKSIFFGND